MPSPGNCKIHISQLSDIFILHFTKIFNILTWTLITQCATYIPWFHSNITTCSAKELHFGSKKVFDRLEVGPKIGARSLFFIKLSTKSPHVENIKMWPPLDSTPRCGFLQVAATSTWPLPPPLLCPTLAGHLLGGTGHLGGNIYM